MKSFILIKLKLLYRKIYRPYIPNSWQWWLTSCFSGKCSKGQDVYIHPSVHMTGVAYVSVGSNSSIGEHTWLNVNHRQKGMFAISIGNNCFIGRRNFFTSGASIVIQDYALTAINCKFICANHISENPLLPYIDSGVTFSDSIYVGVNCFFGADATVLGNVTVGHGSIIGANSLVTKDIPSFSIVIGSPAKVIRRYSFSKKLWINGDQIDDADLSENPDEATYLSILKATHPNISMPLPAAGSNFGNI